MERFRQDLAYGFRSLLRQPGFAMVATLTLALGIGANVAMVSFARAILFPSLPYEDPDRLVLLQRRALEPQSDSAQAPLVSFPALVDWRERNRVCSHFAVLLSDNRNLTGKGGEPERLESLLASASLVTTLGIKPAVGRGFAADDDRLGAGRTVMLSYELWQRRYGGDTEIIDKDIALDDQMYTVIGVLPQGLSSESLDRTRLGDVWLPMGLFYDRLPVDDRKNSRDWVTACRLKPEVTLAAAREDMARITRDLAEEYPSTDNNKTVQVLPIREQHLAGESQRVVLALLAAVVFVLVIACANLIHLFLSRFVARHQEFAVRAALGAGRVRLVMQGLCEALALALTGGLLGMIVSAALVRFLPAVLSDVPYADQARISPFVSTYAVALCLVVTLVIGLIPALQAISPYWQRLLTGSLGPRTFPVHRRLRQSLIVGEIALAAVLLTGTSLAFVTFVNLRDQELGFSPERVLTFEVALPLSNYGEVSKWTAFFDQAIDQTSVLPGVEAVAVTSALPMRNEGRNTPVFAGDRPIPPRQDRQLMPSFIVSPHYFRAMGIPVLEGRTFTSRDDDRLGARQVIVISQSVARYFWPDQSAVGRTVGFEFIGGTIDKPEVVWREVIGVVGDTRHRSLRMPLHHAVYVSYRQRPTWDRGTSPKMAMIVKTATEPRSLRTSVRSELLKIDPSQPVFGIRTMREIIDEQLRQSKMVYVLFSLIAGLALLLSLVGVYGVVSFFVVASTRETGVRMALGASPSQVVARVLRQGLVPILIGIGVGMVLSASLTRLMSSQLYGVDPLEPMVFLAGSVILISVALIGTLVPALQAVRVDPLRSLRYE